MRGTILMKSMEPSRTAVVSDKPATLPGDKPDCRNRAPQDDVDDQRALTAARLRIHPDIDETPKRAGQNRQRQRDHDAPQREVGRP